MKLGFILLIQVIVYSGVAAGFSGAVDPQYSYCDDLSKIDRLEKIRKANIEDFTFDGIYVERVVIAKTRKKLYLISGEMLVREYVVAFGPEPSGHKHFEGDGKTPEGLYTIDFKKADSDFTKALHISYPNETDIRYARSRNRDPGGDIMIHGFPVNPIKNKWVSMTHPKNWTRGCVAVKNYEIEEIFQLVRENTLVEVCSQKEQTVIPHWLEVLVPFGVEP